MWINKFGFLPINQKSPKDITEGILFPLITRNVFYRVKTLTFLQIKKLVTILYSRLARFAYGFIINAPNLEFLLKNKNHKNRSKTIFPHITSQSDGCPKDV